MAHLTLVLDSREVRKFALNRGVTTIGRAQDNDIVINNLALSRRHAQVCFIDSAYELQDLGSQNGVFVNNKRIKNAFTLSDADSVTLGTYQFIFRVDEEDTEDPRPPPKPQRVAPPPATFADDRTDQEREGEDLPSQPLLVLKFNEVELERRPLLGDHCMIGRSKDCDLQIPERRLSRRHCEIIKTGERYVLHDLQSQNGTYVNRKRVDTKQALEDGDILNFAEYTVLFLLDGSAYEGPDRVNAPEKPAIKAASDAPTGQQGDRSFGHRTAPPKRGSPVPVPGSEVARALKTRRQADDTDGVEPLVVSPRDARARQKAPAQGKGAPEPKGQLDDWYDSRQEKSSLYDPLEVPREDSGDMLGEEQSSVSRVLDTMMVNKQELDRHLRSPAAERRFVVDVFHDKEKIFSGPLTKPVTILGTAREADIQLRGRFVAARHSLLVRVHDSLLLVRLGSMSAARVNGLPKLQAFLKSGDVVQIDLTTIKIREE